MKKIILVFLISMVPVVELRGALPYALGPWMGQPLPLLQAYLICIIGNMLPVPLIYLFARKLLEWGKNKPLIGKPFTWCLEKGKKGGEALQKKAGQGLFLALMLFVGIPLPGTGACILDMEFKESVLAVMFGVLLAGIIMLLLSTAGYGIVRMAA